MRCVCAVLAKPCMPLLLANLSGKAQLEPFPTLLEYDMSENALLTERAQEPIPHSGGIVAVPQGPGLGIGIDREVLQKYC